MKTLPDDASSDQTGNIPTGYYRRNTGMLNMLPDESTNPQSPALSVEDVKAICADKDKLRQLAIEELVTIISLNKGDIKGVTACNVLLDRVDGKPGQSIDVSGKVSIVSLVLESYKKQDIPLVDVTPSQTEK